MLTFYFQKIKQEGAPVEGPPLWGRPCSWVRTDRGNGHCHGNEVTRSKAARVPYDTC